jgi:hypothetical protein
MWSFLSNLGSGLTNFGSSMAHGIGKLGRGLKRPGEPTEPGETAPNPMQAPINASPPKPEVRSLEDSVANAERGAAANFGADAGGYSRGPLLRPPAEASDYPELTGPAPYLPNVPMASPDLASGSAAPPLAPASAMAPRNLERSEVPIPALPGQAGGPLAYDPVKAAKFDYVMQGAQRDEDRNILSKDQGGGFKRNWKDVAKNALIGAGRQIAANPRDPIGAAIGGALVGGAGTAINPEKGREFTFDQVEGPRMERDIEKQRRERQQAAEETFKEAQRKQIEAQTNKTNHDVDSDKARDRYIPLAGGALYDTKDQTLVVQPAEKTTKPTFHNVPAGTTVLGSDGKTVYTSPAKPEKPMSLGDAETERAADEGSVDQITNDSMEGRRSALFSKLPPDYQKALNDPEKADTDTLAKAQRAFDQMWKDEYGRVRRYTEGEAKKKAGLIRAGRRPQSSSTGAPSQSTSRPRSQFNSEKFPGLHFD